MTTYVQAVSDRGYKTHAVPSHAERFGLRGICTWGKAVCGIKGRDGNTGLSTMLLRLDREAQEPIPFDRYARNICEACAKKVSA